MKNLDTYITEKILINKNTHIEHIFKVEPYICHSFDELKKLKQNIITGDIINFLKHKNLNFPYDVYNYDEFDNNDDFYDDLEKYRKSYNANEITVDVVDQFSSTNASILYKEREHGYQEIWFLTKGYQKILFFMVPINQKREA